MNFSDEAILAAPPKTAAKLLVEAGRELSGKNLQRSSWLEIAVAIQRQNHLAGIVIQRLRAARTRDDALRVLRIVRKAARNQTRRRSGQARTGRAPGSDPPRRPEIECHSDWEALLPGGYEVWLDPRVFQRYFRNGRPGRPPASLRPNCCWPG